MQTQETSLVSQAIESVEGLGEDNDDQVELEQGIEDDACRELGILEGSFKLKSIYGIKRSGAAGSFSHSTFCMLIIYPMASYLLRNGQKEMRVSVHSLIN